MIKLQQIILKRKKKPQPFFLQVFPPISLYWPFSSLRSTVTAQRVLWYMHSNHSIAAGLLPLQHPAGLYLTVTTTPFFFPFSNPKKGLLFSLISQVLCSIRTFLSAVAEWWGSALLLVQGILSRHPQHYTSALAEAPSPRKSAFSRNSCYSRHFIFIPTHLCLGFERSAIAMACSILRQETWKWEEWDLALRRLRLKTSCRN